jgi:hypothetical protein
MASRVSRNFVLLLFYYSKRPFAPLFLQAKRELNLNNKGRWLDSGQLLHRDSAVNVINIFID